MANAPAFAADHSATVAGPISDTTDYNNLTITNSGTYSSALGPGAGAFVYFGGNVDGDIDFTNTGSITSTHSSYGVLYLPNVGNSPTLKDITLTNSGTLASTGNFATAILVVGALDGSFPDFTRRSFNFSLDNTDYISGKAGGVYITNGDSGTAQITNSGIIRTNAASTYKAISISGGLTTQIDNTGTIEANSASQTAIELTSITGIINNTGAGIITGGIQASGDNTTSLTITNNSTNGITGNILTDHAELDVINTDGIITGNITLGDHADSSVALNGGVINGNILMNNSDQLVTLSNGTFSGTINGAGSVLVSANTITDGNIGNSTGITNLTVASSRTLDAATNSNAITSDTIAISNAATLTTSTYLTGDTTINSNGTLDLQDGAFVTGTIDGFSNNRGSVDTSGLVIMLSPIGTTHAISEINVNSGSQARIANSDSSHANIINAQDINVTGRLDLMDATTITGNLTMLGSSAELNTSGYSQTINGDFTTSSGSMMIVTVQTPSTADEITVSGAADIAAGSKLYLAFTGGSTTAAGSTYTIIDGGVGSSINQILDSDILINGVATNRYLNYLLHTSVSGDDLLLLVQNMAIDVTTSNISSQNVSTAIDNLVSPSGNLATLQDYLLDTGNSNADRAAALESATPQSDNGINQFAFSNSQASIDIVEDRVDIYFKGEGDASDELGRSVWAQGFGARAGQDSSSTAQGFDSRSAGFEMGIDKEISDLSMLGVSASYSNSTIDSNDRLKNTDVDSYQLNLYGAYELEDYLLSSVVGFTWNEYTSSRNIPVAPAVANADFSGQTYTAKIQGSTTRYLADNIYLTPKAGVTLAYNTVENYTETGAGTLNLNVDNDNSPFLEGNIGADIGKEFMTDAGTKITPKVSIGYGYDFIADNQSTTSSFIGQTPIFKSQGAEVEKSSLNLGAGVNIYQKNSVTLSADYDYKYKSNYQSNSGVLRVRYAF